MKFEKLYWKVMRFAVIRLFLMTLLCLPSVTSFAQNVTAKISINRHRVMGEFQPGLGDFAVLVHGAQKIPLQGEAIRILNRIFKDPDSVIRVPVSLSRYGLGVWSGGPVQFEVDWDDAGGARFIGHLPVERWVTKYVANKWREFKTTKRMNISLLELEDFGNYFPHPFESFGTAMEDAAGSIYPMQWVGMYGEDAALIPSYQDRTARGKAKKGEIFSMFKVPLRHLIFSRRAIQPRPFVQFDNGVRQFFYMSEIVTAGFIPGRVDRWAGIGPMLHAEHLEPLIARDIRKPKRLLGSFLTRCYNWFFPPTGP